MIDATEQGRTPDFAHSGYAKRRSVHNSYMTFPVLFTMLSNHYSMAYAHPQNWVILILLVIFGMSVRHVMIAKNGGGKWAIAPSAAALLAMMLMTAQASRGTPVVTDSHAERVSFTEVRQVITRRCVACHSPKPQDPTFGPSPGGVSFEDQERIPSLAERIKVRAVVTKTMPLLNKTGMTEEERQLLARWIEQGATGEGAR
jgi:uncharacterized membrane protein